RTMMPHQAKALVEYADREALGLFWQMRLGKSAPAIRWADAKKDARRWLIACPLSVVPSWERELRFEGHRPVALTGSMPNRISSLVENSDAKFFVVNFEGLMKTGNRTRSGNPKATPSP